MIEPRVFHIACLCAAWCRLCEGYASIFEGVLADLSAPGTQLLPHWIDIEDDADLLGDLDIETFPTLVVIGTDGVRFAGSVEPQGETLQRLLRATTVPSLSEVHRPPTSQEVLAFASALMRRTQGESHPA